MNENVSEPPNGGSDTNDDAELGMATLLVDDVFAALEKVPAALTQRGRRDFFRTTFACIEGLLWRLKEDLIGFAFPPAGRLSIGERALLAEHSYFLDARGNVKVRKRLIPLRENIRFTARIIGELYPGYIVDFDHPAWACMLRSIDVRHRLTHPKTKEDLTINDRQLNEAVIAFIWFLTISVEVMEMYNAKFKKEFGPVLSRLKEHSVKGCATDEQR